MDHIYNNIYIGNWFNSMDYKSLRKHNIKYIICLNTRIKPIEVYKQYYKMNISHMQYHIYDSVYDDIFKAFQNVKPFIDEATTKRANILIHCYAGISRAASIVISELMDRGFTYTNAYNYVKYIRPIINPNEAFRQQMINQIEPYIIASKSNKII